MPQKRLFVAIGFSESLRKGLEPFLKKMRKTSDRKEVFVRWAPLENLHVTLAFLGETDVERISALEEVLASVALAHAPFALKIRKIGAFPEVSHARVLWLGVQLSKALQSLQSDVSAAVRVNSEIPGERDGFVPHLTVGRLRSAKSVRDLISPFAHVDFGRQMVQEIVLYESVLAGNFPVYQEVKRFSLTGKVLEAEGEEEPGEETPGFET